MNYHVNGSSIKAATDLSPFEFARRLGGEVCGSQILAPGPEHSPKDRSLSVLIDRKAPDGFVAHSHAGDDWRVAKDHVKERLGLAVTRCTSQQAREHSGRQRDADQDRKAAAALTWQNALPLADSPAEAYLQHRGIRGIISPALRYRPGAEDDPVSQWPALVAAFWQPVHNQPFSGPRSPSGVQLTFVRPDGSGKAPVDAPKKGRGSCKGTPIALSPIGADGQLVIAEGIEDALSVHLATGFGTWASGGASFLPALAPSAAAAGAKHVVVCVDANDAGKRQSLALGRALKEQGIEVSFMRPEVR